MSAEQERTNDWIGRDVVTFVHLLGLNVIETHPGRVVTSLNLRPDLLNKAGVAHGGVIMSIADITAALTVRTLLPPTAWIATVNLNVTFLKPGLGRLTGEGWIVSEGRSISTAQVHVKGEDGTLLATAIGTFRCGTPE